MKYNTAFGSIVLYLYMGDNNNVILLTTVTADMLEVYLL